RLAVSSITSRLSRRSSIGVMEHAKVPTRGQLMLPHVFSEQSFAHFRATNAAGDHDSEWRSFACLANLCFHRGQVMSQLTLETKERRPSGCVQPSGTDRD